MPPSKALKEPPTREMDTEPITAPDPRADAELAAKGIRAEVELQRSRIFELVCALDHITDVGNDAARAVVARVLGANKTLSYHSAVQIVQQACGLPADEITSSRPALEAAAQLAATKAPGEQQARLARAVELVKTRIPADVPTVARL